MKRMMTKRTGILALMTSATLAATPLMAEPLDIADVEVKTDLEAVDSNALDRWPAIVEDLTLAITAGLADQMTEDGDYGVRVDVTEISNLGAAYLGDDGKFNRIEGWVYVDGPESEDDSVAVKKFHIEMMAEELEGYAPVNATVISPDRAEFYDALVTAFADQTVTDVAALQKDWIETDQADDNS